MLSQILEDSKKFDGCFTVDYMMGSKGVAEDKQNEYIQWLARVGVYAEAKLKIKYPEMTSEIIDIAKSKKIYIDEYNVIIGYLNAVKELGE